MADIKKDTPKSAQTQKNLIIEERILSILGSKPKSKGYLVGMIGENERTIRLAIRSLREQGYPICSLTHGKGYWMGSKEDVRATVSQLRSRAFKLLRVAKVMEGIDPNQITMEEIESWN